MIIIFPPKGNSSYSHLQKIILKGFSVIVDCSVSLWIVQCHYGLFRVIMDCSVSLWIVQCHYGLFNVIIYTEAFWQYLLQVWIWWISLILMSSMPDLFVKYSYLVEYLLSIGPVRARLYVANYFY